MLLERLFPNWRPLLVLLMAAAAQFAGLARDGLWGDEIFTALFAALPPVETIAFTAGDIHPPLYYLLVGLLPDLFVWPGGPPSALTDWLWRWPSALAGVLTVALGYRLARQWLRPEAAAWAALLVATAPLVVKYGQEARMHALFMALSLAATVALLLAMQDQKRRWWAAFALLTALNLYTMYFSFLVLAAHGAWILVSVLQQNPLTWRLWQYRQLRAFAVATVMALLLYLPWWPVLLGLLTYRAQVGAIEGGVGDPSAFLRRAVLALGPDGPGAVLFLGLYCLGLLAWQRTQPALAAFALVWVVLPLSLPLLLGDSRGLQVRYAFVVPVYLLLVVAGTSWLSERTRFPVLVFRAGMVLLLGLNLVGLAGVYTQGKPAWREAAAFVLDRAGSDDVVITGPLWDDGRFFGYYAADRIPILTPPAFALQLPGVAADMAAANGHLWLVTRHQVDTYDEFQPYAFYGVTVLQATRPEYDPVRLIDMVADLCRHAARRADVWAAEMEAGGVLNPDPRSSAAAGYRCEGDTYAVVGRPEQALRPYERAVESFPGWAGGHVLLAKTYAAVDNLPAAVAAFEQAVALNPRWQTSQAATAQQKAAAGDLSGAVELYLTLTD